MKNIPIFTTEAGVASLILEQVNFNKTAYIQMQDACDPDKLLMECAEFCRAVGAEKIYASGKKIPEMYNDFASIIRLSRSRSGLEGSTGILTLVESDSLEQFRQIYNIAMREIPNAASMTMSKAVEILSEKSGYFIHRENELVGIGITKGEWVHAIVSLKRGMGEFIMRTLNRTLTGDSIRIEVIDSNLPAMRLYKRMGFVKYEVVSNWYRIF